MRKRLIIPVSVLLVATSILLLLSIFKLYTEAEKVQRSIFVSEVFHAGESVVNKIDAVLKGDSIEGFYSEVRNHEDATVFRKYAKKYILDSLSRKPIGMVRSTISYTENDVLITQYDTTYFDTTYLELLPYNPTQWTTDFDAVSDNSPSVIRPSSTKKDLLEMDSNTMTLLNQEFLHRIIKESLGDIAQKYQFDFALYNELTGRFVVLPSISSPEVILKSGYIFSLKKSDRYHAQHTIIIYFPLERGIYFQMMKSIALLILFFLGVILIISGLTLYYLYRQKKLTDVRNDFINNITHEFKTPIATISLACEAMTDKGIIEEPAVREAYVSIIRDENERLKNMVNNILQLAQLKKGQLKINVEKVNIHELIKSVTESVALQISSRNGVLSLKLEAKNPIVFGDKAHIENAIINLVENAIKYSKESPDIKIATQNDKKYLVISVKDHGIGISKKNKKKIFGEFYRVSKGNVHDTKGFGMGLDYVKKVLSLHGGNITVESELNKGSVFTLYLPNKKE